MTSPSCHIPALSNVDITFCIFTFIHAKQMCALQHQRRHNASNTRLHGDIKIHAKSRSEVSIREQKDLYTANFP